MGKVGQAACGQAGEGEEAEGQGWDFSPGPPSLRLCNSRWK